jgi:hypothetical protein
MPLFLFATAVVAAIAVLRKTCALTGCDNDLKCPLFILLCLVTFMAGST